MLVGLVIPTCAMTSHLAGKDLAMWTLKISSIVGGSLAFLASNFRSGLLIVCYALFVAMAFTIGGATYLAYDPVPLDTLEKTPIDYPTLMLFGFLGSAFGGSVAGFFLGEIRWKHAPKG